MNNQNRPEWDQRYEQWQKGRTDPEIAKALGIPYQTVVSWRRAKGLPRNADTDRPPPWSQQELDRLRRLSQKLDRAEIARILGRTCKSVSLKAARMRIKLKRRRERIEHTGPTPRSEYRRKITQEEYEKLITLQALYLKGRKLAPDTSPGEIITAAIEAMRSDCATEYGKIFSTLRHNRTKPR